MSKGNKKSGNKKEFQSNILNLVTAIINLIAALLVIVEELTR